MLKEMEKYSLAILARVIKEKPSNIDNKLHMKQVAKCTLTLVLINVTLRHEKVN